MLDQAFEKLKKFDFGTPLSEVQAIDDAVVAAHSDAAVRKDLDGRLIAALGSAISRDAKDYVCRKVAVIGSSAAVPALAPLLSTEPNAHMARHALERIPGPEAAEALATAAMKLTGKLKIGAIGSLGARREVSGVATLAGLVSDSDPAVARAAALSLGMISGPEASGVLRTAIQSEAGKNKNDLIDALLSCAESLLHAGKGDVAAVIYQFLSDEKQPRLVRLAATRGLLACSDA